MLISDNGLDMHINPYYIIRVWKTGSRETYYFAKIRGERDYVNIDKDSYDRIVEWMEQHDV